MPITDVRRDLEAMSLTIIGEFPVSVRRLWDAYVDPRQIERFWSRVGWPATFLRHDLHPGGQSRYEVRGPTEVPTQWCWDVIEVDAPSSFEVVDGIVRTDGSPHPEAPSLRMVYRFDPTDDGSRLSATIWFASRGLMQELLQWGMDQGILSAMGQIDEVVTDLISFEDTRPAEAQQLSDTMVRISRVVRGSLDQVWKAHQDPKLLRQWLAGPAGWAMPVCTVATAVGRAYRYEWAPPPARSRPDGSGAIRVTGERYGLTGELIESHPPYRMVTTERRIGTEGPTIVNDLSLTTVEGGTLVTVVIDYPTAELREQALANGKVAGLEASYRRLESEVLDR